MFTINSDDNNNSAKTPDWNKYYLEAKEDLGYLAAEAEELTLSPLSPLKVKVGNGKTNLPFEEKFTKLTSFGLNTNTLAQPIDALNILNPHIQEEDKLLNVSNADTFIEHLNNRLQDEVIREAFKVELEPAPQMADVAPSNTSHLFYSQSIPTPLSPSLPSTNLYPPAASFTKTFSSPAYVKNNIAQKNNTSYTAPSNLNQKRALTTSEQTTIAQKFTSQSSSPIPKRKSSSNKSVLPTANFNRNKSDLIKQVNQKSLPSFNQPHKAEKNLEPPLNTVKKPVESSTATITLNSTLNTKKSILPLKTVLASPSTLNRAESVKPTERMAVDNSIKSVITPKKDLNESPSITKSQKKKKIENKISTPLPIQDPEIAELVKSYKALGVKVNFLTLQEKQFLKDDVEFINFYQQIIAEKLENVTVNSLEEFAIDLHKIIQLRSKIGEKVTTLKEALQAANLLNSHLINKLVVKASKISSSLTATVDNSVKEGSVNTQSNSPQPQTSEALVKIGHRISPKLPSDDIYNLIVTILNKSYYFAEQNINPNKLQLDHFLNGEKLFNLERRELKALLNLGISVAKAVAASGAPVKREFTLNDTKYELLTALEDQINKLKELDIQDIQNNSSPSQTPEAIIKIGYIISPPPPSQELSNLLDTILNKTHFFAKQNINPSTVELDHFLNGEKLFNIDQSELKTLFSIGVESIKAVLASGGKAVKREFTLNNAKYELVTKVKEARNKLEELEIYNDDSQPQPKKRKLNIGFMGLDYSTPADIQDLISKIIRTDISFVEQNIDPTSEEFLNAKKLLPIVHEESEDNFIVGMKAISAVVSSKKIIQREFTINGTTYEFLIGPGNHIRKLFAINQFSRKGSYEYWDTQAKLKLLYGMLDKKLNAYCSQSSHFKASSKDYIKQAVEQFLNSKAYSNETKTIRTCLERLTELYTSEREEFNTFTEKNKLLLLTTWEEANKIFMQYYKTVKNIPQVSEVDLYSSLTERYELLTEVEDQINIVNKSEIQNNSPLPSETVDEPLKVNEEFTLTGDELNKSPDSEKPAEKSILHIILQPHDDNISYLITTILMIGGLNTQENINPCTDQLNHFLNEKNLLNFDLREFQDNVIIAKESIKTLLLNKELVNRKLIINGNNYEILIGLNDKINKLLELYEQDPINSEGLYKYYNTQIKLELLYRTLEEKLTTYHSQLSNVKASSNAAYIKQEAEQLLNSKAYSHETKTIRECLERLTELYTSEREAFNTFNKENKLSLLTKWGRANKIFMQYYKTIFKIEGTAEESLNQTLLTSSEEEGQIAILSNSPNSPRDELAENIPENEELKLKKEIVEIATILNVAPQKEVEFLFKFLQSTLEVMDSAQFKSLPSTSKQYFSSLYQTLHVLKDKSQSNNSSVLLKSLLKDSKNIDKGIERLIRGNTIFCIYTSVEKNAINLSPRNLSKSKSSSDEEFVDMSGNNTSKIEELLDHYTVLGEQLLEIKEEEFQLLKDKITEEFEKDVEEIENNSKTMQVNALSKLSILSKVSSNQGSLTMEEKTVILAVKINSIISLRASLGSNAKSAEPNPKPASWNKVIEIIIHATKESKRANAIKEQRLTDSLKDKEEQENLLISTKVKQKTPLTPPVTSTESTNASTEILIAQAKHLCTLLSNIDSNLLNSLTTEADPDEIVKILKKFTSRERKKYFFFENLFNQFLKAWKAAPPTTNIVKVLAKQNLQGQEQFFNFLKKCISPDSFFYACSGYMEFTKPFSMEEIEKIFKIFQTPQSAYLHYRTLPEEAKTLTAGLVELINNKTITVDAWNLFSEDLKDHPNIKGFRIMASIFELIEASGEDFNILEETFKKLDLESEQTKEVAKETNFSIPCFSAPPNNLNVTNVQQPSNRVNKGPNL